MGHFSERAQRALWEKSSDIIQTHPVAMSVTTRPMPCAVCKPRWARKKPIPAVVAVLILCMCVCVLRERETEKRQRERRCVCVCGVCEWCVWVACVNSRYCLLHSECHFFILYSQSMILFSRSLLPRSVEKRPRRLRLEIEIKWRSKCNSRYHQLSRFLYCVDVRVRVCVRKLERKRAMARARARARERESDT